MSTATINQGARWGLLGTTLWALVIALGFILTQILVVGVYIGAVYGDVPQNHYLGLMQDLEYNGTLLSVSTFMTMLVGCSMTVVIIWLKKGSVVREYLGWRLPDRRQALRFFIGFALFVAATDAVTLAFDKPVVTDFMIEAYLTASSPWLLLGALVVGAPLLEEVLFRGFLFSGLEHSVLGPIGAAVVSSLLWAAIHTQYEFFYLVTIFVMGLLLCWMRRKSGSLLLTIGLHAFANMVASLETLVTLS